MADQAAWPGVRNPVLQDPLLLLRPPVGPLGLGPEARPGATDDSLCQHQGSVGFCREGSGPGQAGLGMGALSGGEGGRAP